MTERDNMSESVRILQVIGSMNRGGAETMIMNLYRKIDRTKIQFDFVENNSEEAAFDEEIRFLGGKIYRCPHYNGRNHFQYKEWWNDFFEKHMGEYQIVHGHLGSTAAIYLKIAKKYGLYTIAHSHSSGTDHSLKAILYQMLSYNTRNVADYFFACSKVAGKDRFGKKIVEKNNFTILKNAVDTSIFDYDLETRKVVREELNYLDKQLVIGHIGRFTSEKNHKFLLEVFKAIIDLNEDAQLLLIGDGPLREEIERRAKALDIQDKVRFVGIRSDVNQLLQAMDVFVFPSLYEGLPVTLVEAQTSGLPGVISDKVPQESIITKGLITVESLENDAKIWAMHILSRINSERMGHVEEIKKNGYDITETARWLGGFYLERCK